MSGHPLRKPLTAAILILAAAFLTNCSTPLHSWDVHTASTPRSPHPDTATLARGPVATLGLAAPAALQGFGPALSHALTDALAEAPRRSEGSPPTRS